jgi:hypothetical protein
MQTLKKLSTALLIFLSSSAYSQNVGIGVVTPTEALSVSKGLNIDHENGSNGTTLVNGLRFGNTAVNGQMVGISGNYVGATLPASLYSLGFYTANARRMIITQSGKVGIGLIPVNYAFEVDGTIRAGFNLRADGSVYTTDVFASGSIYASDDVVASAGDIKAPNGVLKAGGDGVIMNNGAGRMRLATYTITFNAGGAGLPSEATATGLLNISGSGFTSAPTVYLGNVINENGEYYKATITFENVTTTSVTCRLTNLCPNDKFYGGNVEGYGYRTLLTGS